MRALMIALAVALLTLPALAQEGGRGSKHRGGGEQKTEQQTKSKADEKDYKSALDRIPEQKYDPWGTTRPSDAKH
ncbi:MAG TPA: hypothetical protein VLX44_05425 [Xanthobacteraceae bacterium]|nr:hypothetical protein [Xanthobacteraceae bacterium]